MKILAIGNSFSQDAQRYLKKIAEAEQTPLTACNLVIGGCSLERHDSNRLSGAKEYSYEKNGEATGETVSLEEGLRRERWDIVTMQQASHFSPRYETYTPYIRSLSEYVRSLAPQAEQVIHQTWAYEQGSERLTRELGYREQGEMFADLKAAYANAARALGGLRLIPGGEAFQKALQKGLPTVHRDTFHADLGLGRYLLGAVWFMALTGKELTAAAPPVLDIPYDEGLLPIVRESALEAVREYR